VTSADVVDGYAHAEALQGGHHTARLGQTLQRLALGDLQHDLRQPDRRLLEDPADVLDDVLVVEMTRRLLVGCRVQKDARILPRQPVAVN